jgi:hypothetical protein
VSEHVAKQAGRSQLLLRLTLTGLLSGLITDVLACSIKGSSGIYWIGGVFGFVVGIGLLLAKRLRRAWMAVVMIVPTALAFWMSLWVAGTTLHWTDHPSFLFDTETTITPLGAFTGGIVGGFMVLATFSAACYPKMGILHVTVESLKWSPVGGILGVVGWSLGPFLGIAIWFMLRALGLTPLGQTSLNAVQTGSINALSLYVVWQAGMCVALSFMLDRSFKSRIGQSVQEVGSNQSVI